MDVQKNLSLHLPLTQSPTQERLWSTTGGSHLMRYFPKAGISLAILQSWYFIELYFDSDIQTHFLLHFISGCLFSRFFFWWNGPVGCKEKAEYHIKNKSALRNIKLSALKGAESNFYNYGYKTNPAKHPNEVINKLFHSVSICYCYYHDILKNIQKYVLKRVLLVYCQLWKYMEVVVLRRTVVTAKRWCSKICMSGMLGWVIRRWYLYSSKGCIFDIARQGTFWA